MYPRTTDMEEMARRCAADTLAFYRYWEAKRQQADSVARRMPAKRDIDPAEIKPFLPFIQIVDVVPDADHPLGRRLVYRLVGEMEIEVRGFNPTGRTVDEALFLKLLDEEMEGLRQVLPASAFETGRFAEAVAIFKDMSLSEACEEFLTLPAYRAL